MPVIRSSKKRVSIVIAISNEIASLNAFAESRVIYENEMRMPLIAFDG